MQMKLIVGLGNPGKEYEATRHNIGFLAIDDWAQKVAARSSWKAQFRGLFVSSPEAYLLKPMTFMNLSGESVAEAVRFYKIDVNDVCVIHDELDLPQGTVRLKIGGGHGGHNGLKSIAQHFGGATNFARIRMGIGRPPHPGMDPADYVLGVFSKPEQILLDEMKTQAGLACEAFCNGSFLKLMNTMNQRSSEKVK